MYSTCFLLYKIPESKVARKILYEAFAEADEILKEEIDKIMEVVKEQHRDFYDQYKAARMIRDIGGHWSKNGKTGNGETVANVET